VIREIVTVSRWIAPPTPAYIPDVALVSLIKQFYIVIVPFGPEFGF